MDSMMTVAMRSILVGTMILGTACGGGGAKATGGGTAATAAPTGGGDAQPAGGDSGKAMTQAQLKLGHFVTADGMHGFTLDRTGAKARLQVDGERDVIELTMEEDRKHGELRGYAFVDPANKKRIYISTRGSLLYYRQGDEFWASFDKDAAPLGAPTIKGAPVKPVSALDTLTAELTPITVRAKLPAFTAADASNLTKIAEAFAQADVSMFVRYKHPGKDGWPARMQVTPDNLSGTSYGGSEYVTDEDEAKRHPKLAKHGAIIIGSSTHEREQGNHILVRQKDSSIDELADKTPGVLWEIDGTRAVFVSLDGGRYRVDLSQKVVPIERGAGPEAGWPAPATDTYQDITTVSGLAKAEAVPAKTFQELEKIDLEWNACVVKGWKAAIRKIEGGKMSTTAIKDEIKKLHKGCNKALDKFETVLVKFAEDRAKARKALFVTASARVKSVGANK